VILPAELDCKRPLQYLRHVRLAAYLHAAQPMYAHGTDTSEQASALEQLSSYQVPYLTNEGPLIIWRYSAPELSADC
jgi:hypothetical protein